jgi:hypothetical protein
MKDRSHKPVAAAVFHEAAAQRPARRALNRRGPAPLVLEQRVMFDGAIVDTAIAAERTATDTATADKTVDNTQAPVPAAVTSPATASETARHEILFIEDNVDNFQQLVAGVKNGVEVVVLDHTRDGIQQMVDAVKGSGPLDAIHLVSHGAEGQIELGAVSLTNFNIDSYRDQLAALGASLTSNGDFLIYGCDVAATPAGQSLIATLGAMTGADVAASTNTTGGSAYGGDWTLEASTGPIETTVFDGGADYGSRLTTIALTSASSTWVPVLNGSIFDPGQDLQAQSAIDLVGNSSNTLLYMKYDSGADNVIGTADDEIAFRVRMDQAVDNQSNYNGYTWMGIDVDKDNDLDVFVMAFMNSSKQFTLNMYQAGSGAQTSPSTTALDSQHPTALSGASYSLGLVTSIDSGGTANVDGDSNNDYFLSFKVNASTFFNNLNGKTLTGQGTTISGVNKDTSLQFVLATAQNENALNGDVGGYGTADSSSATYASKGIFVVTSFGDPASATVAASDTTPPTVTITSDKTALKAGDTATLSFTFSEDVGTSFTAGDVTLESGSLSNFTKIDATHYTATYTPAADTTDSSMVASIGVGKFTDTAGTPNANTAAATLNLGIDTQLPLISGPSGAAGDAVAAKTINENITAVHTFTASETVNWSIVGGEDQAKFQIDASGHLSFVSAPDYENPTDGSTSGTNTYIVQVKAVDAAGNAALQTVTVSIADVNESGPDSTAPTVGSGQSFVYAENQAQNASIGTVIASDNIGVTGFRFTDTGTATSADGYFAIAGNGAVTITAAGVAAGVAQNDFETAPNSFTYAVQAGDAAGNWSASETIALAVTNADEVAPAFTSSTTANAAESQNLLYTAQATDNVDFTNHTVTYSLKSGVGDVAALSINATTGAVTLASGNLDFATKSGYSFTVIASDATGNTREQAVAVSVTSNDQTPPTVTITSDKAALKSGETATLTFTFSEDVGSSFAASDIAVESGSVTNLTKVDATHYTATYTPATSTTDSSMVVTVGIGTFSDVASNANAVAGTLDLAVDTLAPVITGPASATGTTSARSVAENTTAVHTFTASETVSWSIGGGEDQGKFQIDSNGNLSFKTAPDYETPTDGNTSGLNTYVVQVNATDNAGNVSAQTVTVTVTNVNEAPAAGNASITTNEDTAKSGSLPAASDVDGDTVTYTKAGDPAHGAVTVNTDGSYTYTPSANYNGADSFSYTISDGNGGTNTYTVSITVDPVNDAPVASTVAPTAGTVGTPLTPLTVPVFTDIDGPTISYSATLSDGSPLPAWLSFDPATRTFSGTPPAHADGSYVLKVTGSDGTLSDSVSFTLTVQNPQASDRVASITSMTKDTGSSPTDFITSDGSANRTVTGTLDAALGQNEVVQVSFDGGATWNTATTNGTAWSIVDGGAHGADWTIQARVTNTAADVAGTAASRAVTLDTTAPATPTVDTLSTTSTTPVLSGTANVKSGELLQVRVNGATYDVVPQGGKWTLDLASATPVSGTLGTIVAGNSYDVAATIKDAAGNAASDLTTSELHVSVPPTPPVTTPVPVNTAPLPTPVDIAPQAPVPPQIPEPRPMEMSPVVPGSVVGNDSIKFGSGQGARSSESFSELNIRRDAALSDVYTRSEGFRTVVAKADDPALVLFQGVPDQYAEAGSHISMTVPADAFAHTQPKAVVRLVATLQDGRPLPTWVQFNSQTGQLSGDVPKGLVSELRVKLIARDMEGREATALFRINVGTVKGTNGKTGLSEQLRRSGMPAARDGRPAAPVQPRR